VDAVNQIKAVYDDGVAEINGTSYTFTKFTHAERLKVFAFYSSLIKDQRTGDVRMDFWDEPKFHEVQKLLDSKITVDGMQVSKIADYWSQEENMDDFIPLMMTALQVVCYPFLRGRLGV
jgi:hypothetical protein